VREIGADQGVWAWGSCLNTESERTEEGGRREDEREERLVQHFEAFEPCSYLVCTVEAQILRTCRPSYLREGGRKKEKEISASAAAFGGRCEGVEEGERADLRREKERSGRRLKQGREREDRRARSWGLANPPQGRVEW